MFRNVQLARLLWFILATEVGLGVLVILATGAISSLIIIVIIFSLVATIGFITRTMGLWSGDWMPPAGNNQGVKYGGNFPPNVTSSGQPGPWGLNVEFNLGNAPEHTDIITRAVPVPPETTLLAVNVPSGFLQITGQEGTPEIQLRAVRRVRFHEQAQVRQRLEKLQVHTWQDGKTLRIEAGDPAQPIVIGDAPRVDLELLVPAALAANLTTNAGPVACRQYHGELTVRTTLGTITVEGYSSGRNVNLNSTSGAINLQNVAAGTIRARTLAGVIQLTGVGAELLELETTAGSIRTRALNCGRYLANATTGSVELYEATVEDSTELKTGAGRIQVEGLRSAAYRFEATTGTILFRGYGPVAASEVLSRAGSVQMVFLPGTGFTLDAQSKIGTVQLQLPVSGAALHTRNIFQGQIAGGGAPLRVISQVGSIRLGVGHGQG